MMSPPPYILDTGYADIERAATEFIASKGADDTRLRHLDNALLLRKAVNDHEEQRLLNAHDAIEHVLLTDWRYPDRSQISSADCVQKTFKIGQVTVSVSPTVFLRSAQKGKRSGAVGLGKTYFGKSWPLAVKDDAERGTLYAALLHWFAQSAINEKGDVVPALTLVGDVFSRRVFVAPANYKQRRKQLAASAQEIEDRWSQIKQRLEAKEAEKKASF
jgi:hypothetical protein